jgi:hypothetical protein
MATAAPTGMVSLTWSPPIEQVLPGIKAWTARLRAKIYAVAMHMADQITAWMQSNAPWEDRTGEARAGLRAWAVQMATGAYIVLAHGVPYGIYLERMKAGSLGILAPAVQYWAPQFIQAMRSGGVA